VQPPGAPGRAIAAEGFANAVEVSRADRSCHSCRRSCLDARAALRAVKLFEALTDPVLSCPFSSTALAWNETTCPEGSNRAATATPASDICERQARQTMSTRSRSSVRRARLCTAPLGGSRYRALTHRWLMRALDLPAIAVDSGHRWPPRADMPRRWSGCNVRERWQGRHIRLSGLFSGRLRGRGCVDERWSRVFDLGRFGCRAPTTQLRARPRRSRPSPCRKRWRRPSLVIAGYA